jgi:hypothetical protein
MEYSTKKLKRLLQQMLDDSAKIASFTEEEKTYAERMIAASNRGEKFTPRQKSVLLKFLEEKS